MRLLVEEEFVQIASAVPSLRAILEGYSLSAGIFRELLANSDDAGASKQIFVLDRRNHATEGLYHDGLAGTQGPAFMAFNDAVFSAQDWEALKSIHDSSKSTDESKIGKYGVGFRSVFNLTDSPQILSDHHLAILDPLCLHLGSEGKIINLGHLLNFFPNHLSPFEPFVNNSLVPPFPGTVIRCPLRRTPSRISDQVVTSEIMSKLFEEFMDQEMGISCLFLNNIECIEIHVIAPTGVSNLLASMVISRSVGSAEVRLDRYQHSENKKWHIMRSNFSRDEAINMFQKQLGYDSTIDRILHDAKFSPEVKIALDITGTGTSTTRGRLFSFLPLPIFTGFPVHVHALFGIDASRTNLRRDSVGLASGSWDHTKVQWNTMLFQAFIPRTWCYLLEEMVSRSLVSNIFSIWPPETSSGELEPYFPLLSRELVNDLLATKAAVWPVYELQSKYGNLESLVVASPAERESILQALARVGVSLTRPPRYIFDLLCDLSKERILNPEVAHILLRENIDEITRASDEDHKLLLEYLLSTKNILNICGLSLIPTANGEKVAISDARGGPVYTMLTRSEFEIFGSCDELSIPLHRLSPNVEDTLLLLRPGSVNVQRLTVPRIVEYLSMYSVRLGLDGRLNVSVVRWLSKFWEWMDRYEYKGELFRQIRNFLLLPSMKGPRKAESALFKLRGEHPAHTGGYLAIGVPFFAHDFSDVAHDVLQRFGLVKSIWDISALLDSLASIDIATVPRTSYESILKHLSLRLDESVDQERIQLLRSLPIFPVLTCAMTGKRSTVATSWTSIPQGHLIRSLGRPKFVPLVNGISFVGLQEIAPGMDKFLKPSYPDPTSENDLIELAVENFTTQPEHLQLTLLQHITHNKNRIFPSVITKLRSQAFVLAEDGEYHAPGDIVDPKSDIGPLYIGCPEYRPSSVGDFWPEMLLCLRLLGCLRVHLTPDIAAERIEYISSRHTSDEALLIARSLLLLLGSSNIDFSLVQGIAEKKWLSTNKGICSAEMCRHAAITAPALFDKVLAVLGRNFAIPPSLQTALGWDKPLPIKLLIEQLNRVLHSELAYDVVVEIVREFGRRQWSDDDVASLEKIVRDRQWIPTTDGVLADVKSSVFKFSSMMLNSGFYQIRADLKAECLLQRMGCTEHPLTRAVLDKLHALDQDPNHVDLVGMSISLLRSLPDGMTVVERAKLLIPDQDSRLRPFSKVFYNDIGENSCLLNNDGHFIAHQSVDESLANKLGLDHLGLKYADLRNVGPNMGQAPITTVRRTLQQYTNQQFLLEFLANADDAEATVFSVALNLTTVDDDQDLHVLSSAMAYLCKLPSLVIHNDARFKQEDFDGICNTSLGGKAGRADTIGEFGLGVLTMYHFTDLAIVISGSRVLFMDPSRKHLPRPDLASMNLSLERVQLFYKDHLIALHGLFDFDMSSPSYDGTLFVLPLRQSQEVIISDPWSPERITSEILEPFKTLASDCLLFPSHIRTIRCITRTDQNIALRWSFTAQRTQIMVPESGYVLHDIKIFRPSNPVAHWKTVTTSCTDLNQLPLEFRELRRSPFAGLAARLDKASPDGRSFNFFSILPLATTTTLPMHVMASFILSSDRRQIRLDSFEKQELRYNTWLLKELIPPLYLFFLEHLLQSGDEHYLIRWPNDKGDALSNHIVESFYSSKHLTPSIRCLFPSIYRPGLVLSPQDAILQVKEPLIIRRIMDLLKPDRLVDLPSGPRELADRAGVSTVNPVFVKQEILHNPAAITSDIDFQLIPEIILYLSGQKGKSHILCDLPILPLENGSFGTLSTPGTGTFYYLWKPKDNSKRHNFSEEFFVHPRMKTKDLKGLKLNILPLDVAAIKDFVATKLSTFPQPIVSPAQLQWIDSFWDSWEEYSKLGLVPEDIASFPLVPTTQSSYLVCLDQCKNGSVLLVQGDHGADRALCTSLRQLELLVVHVDGQIHSALCNILKQPIYPRLNLQNVLSAISRKGIPIADLFNSLDDDLKIEFAAWARANISQTSEDQLSLAQSLPIWWSAGGGLQRALRPSSEVRLLPDKVSLEDAAHFMVDCVTDDASLTHLNKKHMTIEELPHRLLLPDVLDMPTLLQYKQFFEIWQKQLPLTLPPSIQSLLVPNSVCTLQSPQDLFERGPHFMAIFPENSPFFVHSEFQDFEEVLGKFGLQSEERLDVRMFTIVAESLDLDDPDAVSRASEVFRVYSNILPRRISEEERDTWRELDDIPFIPRRMATVRKLATQGENETGLVIPMSVTQLPDILSPSEFVRERFEAIAWSQRACFEAQPSERAYIDYPELGRPTFSVVLAHLRYLSTLSFQGIQTSQRQILLHDLVEVYEYFDDNLDNLRENEELAQTILFVLRNERLFLNIDVDEDHSNWVRGSSLAIDCHVREGSIQDVRGLLRPFEDILLAAGALKVQHPTYSLERDAQPSESKPLAIWPRFNQLRKDEILTDVKFIVQDTSVPPLFAHRVFLAASSEYFENYFCGDFQESRSATPGPVTIEVNYSWQCVRSFLDHVYIGNKGEGCSLELLLEILGLSSYYHVADLFDEVQGEIIQRKLLRPDTVDMIRAEAEELQAVRLLNACTQYESQNIEFIRRSMC